MIDKEIAIMIKRGFDDKAKKLDTVYPIVTGFLKKAYKLGL